MGSSRENHLDRFLTTTDIKSEGLRKRDGGTAGKIENMSYGTCRGGFVLPLGVPTVVICGGGYSLGSGGSVLGGMWADAARHIFCLTTLFFFSFIEHIQVQDCIGLWPPKLLGTRMPNPGRRRRGSREQEVRGKDTGAHMLDKAWVDCQGES